MKRFLPLIALLITLAVSPFACKKLPTTSSTVIPVSPSTPDTASRFQNPLLSSGPDPWVIYQDGFYYVMHTTGGDLRLYKTKKMSLLGQSQTSVVWSPPATGPATRDIWAPELHRVNNRWYIYYAAVVAPSTTHRMWVLENESADPMAGTWVAKGQLQLPDDRWAIDGTLLQVNGGLYYAWSGWENAERNNIQHIYLCKLKNPWTPDGPRLRVSTPEYDWEKQGTPLVNEGPEFMKHGNHVFLVYSASHCSTDAYALGMLTADTTANLMSASSWKKSAQPVFGPNASGGAYGVGHNGFFTTSDGRENWIIYHANPLAGQGCSDKRSPRMQRFTWKADGSPDFGKPIPLAEWIKRPSGE
ncbi:glycoside hydrolase family 43 protein [soil metagenome]